MKGDDRAVRSIYAQIPAAAASLLAPGRHRIIGNLEFTNLTDILAVEAFFSREDCLGRSSSQPAKTCWFPQPARCRTHDRAVAAECAGEQSHSAPGHL